MFSFGDMDSTDPAPPTTTVDTSQISWYEPAHEHDYYSALAVQQADEDADRETTGSDALPSAYLAQLLFDAAIFSISAAHHAHSSFNSLWTFMVRYVTRSKSFIEFYPRNDPPWKDDPEAVRIAAGSGSSSSSNASHDISPPYLANTELRDFNVLHHTAFKANTAWYTRKRAGLSASNPTFTYTKHAVEIHYDNLRPWPPGCTPKRSTDGSSSSEASSSVANFVMSSTAAAAVAAGHVPVINGMHVMSYEEAVAKGINLEGEIWCKAHRIFVSRTITERWIAPETIVVEPGATTAQQLMSSEYPEGEDIFVGMYTDLVGSTTSPSVPRNIGNPARLAQLQKLSTPRTLEEFNNPGGFSVYNGKMRCPASFFDRRQHALLICKRTSNGKPMGIIHFESILTGSIDNVMIRIDGAKAITYKKDEMSPNSTIMMKAKTRIGTSGNRSVIGFLEQERVTMPDAHYRVMDLPTAVAVANKFAPAQGNSHGFDARYQTPRIRAGHHHTDNFLRAKFGVPLVSTEFTHISPYDRTPITKADVTCTKNDTERIRKVEKNVSTNTRATEVIIIQVHIQRIMMYLPIIPFYFALGDVTLESIKHKIGLPDLQMDFDPPPPREPTAAEKAAERALERASELDASMVDLADAFLAEEKAKATTTKAATADGHVETVTEGDDEEKDGEDEKEEEEEEEMVYTLDDTMRGVDKEPRTSAPPPHQPPTSLNEKRRTYEDIIDRSFEMFAHIPVDRRQYEMIVFIGDLYCSNIQIDYRSKTPYEYGLYFLEQCFLSMQGVLSALKDDFEKDVPILEALRTGANGGFGGSHTLKNVILDDQTRRVFWKKSMALSTGIVNPFLRVWCGFRGEQYGQLCSFDEYQCGSMGDINKHHFRCAWRQIKDTQLKDIKRDPGVLFQPLQRYFQPHKAFQKIVQDNAAERAISGQSLDTSNVIVVDNHSPYPYHLTRLAREYTDIEPVTKLMRKTTTKYEEDTRRGGSAVMQLYLPNNEATRMSAPRRVIAIANAHAGGVSRQYKVNFQSLLCFYDTSTNDSSGQNNGLAVGATISRTLTQQEHVSVFRFVQLLILTKMMMSADDVYEYWQARYPFGETMDVATSVVPSSSGPRVQICGDAAGLRSFMRDNAPPEHFYTLTYGTDFLGWIHRDMLDAVYHKWWMLKTHPNATDGIRLLSLEVIHATRQFNVHMNPGRVSRLTWVVDVKQKQLRATRVSRKLRRLIDTPAESWRQEDKMSRREFFEELMLRRCVEWVDYAQARHISVASSFAAFADSRLRDDIVYGAIEYHPASSLGFTALGLPGIDENGGARTQAANTMAKSMIGHKCGSWAANGEMRPPFTSVYPQRQVLRTNGPVSLAKDGVQGVVAWYNNPYTDQDSTIVSHAATDLGAAMIMINDSFKSVHDRTRQQAETTLHVNLAKMRSMPTQLQKQMSELELARKIHQNTVQQKNRLASLSLAPNAATSIFASHSRDKHAQHETILQHNTVWGVKAFVPTDVTHVQGVSATNTHDQASSAHPTMAATPTETMMPLSGGVSGITSSSAGMAAAAAAAAAAGAAAAAAVTPTAGVSVPTNTGATTATSAMLSTVPIYSRSKTSSLGSYVQLQQQQQQQQTTYLLEQDGLHMQWKDVNRAGASAVGAAIGGSYNGGLTSGSIVRSAYSTGPRFNFDTYCAVMGQSRYMIENDIFIDETNTVSFPAYLAHGMTMLRPAILTPDLVELHRRRAHTEQENEKLKQFWSRQKHASALQNNNMTFIHPPSDELPPVEYNRIPFKSKKMQMELLGFYWTMDDLMRIHNTLPFGRLHHHSKGGKSSLLSGQKTVTSLHTDAWRLPFTVTDESPGSHASRAYSVLAFPTRRTMSNHNVAVSNTMACLDPSRRLVSTCGDTYQQAPSMFNETLLAHERKCVDVLQYNPYMIERMESKKNHTRFGLLVQREVMHIVRATLERQRSWVFHTLHALRVEHMPTPERIVTCDSYVIDRLIEQTLRKTTAAILQVCEWWTDIAYSEEVQTRLDALGRPDDNSPTIGVANLIDGMFDVDRIRAAWQTPDGWWSSGNAFLDMLPAVVPMESAGNQLPPDVARRASISAHLRQRPIEERLLWLWFKDVHTECVDAMHTADVFWVELMHDLQCIQRENERMSSLRSDITALGTAITDDICRNLAYQARQQHQQQQQQQQQHHQHHHHHHQNRATDEMLDATTLMHTIRPQLLEQQPGVMPASFADQKRTFDKLCLDLLQMSHRLAVVWTAVFPQVERLEHVFQVCVRRGICNEVVFGGLKRVFAGVRTFADAVRDYSRAHELHPTELLTHRHLQFYIEATQNVAMEDVYASLHRMLRPETDTHDNRAYWQMEKYAVWHQTLFMVRMCVHGGDAGGADDGGVDGVWSVDNPADSEAASWYSNDPSDAVTRKTFGYQRNGILAPLRKHWNRCWSAHVCHMVMQQMMFLPLRVWRMRDDGANDDSNNTDPTAETATQTLAQRLHGHNRTFSYMITRVPQLMKMAHLIVLSRTQQGQTIDSPEIQTYLRALQIELKGIMVTIPEQAINGETGRPLLGGMWMGVTHEMTLPKVAQDLFKSRTTGPVHVLSGQPAATTDGQGSGRWGKMEIGALIGAGSSKLAQTFTREYSDFFQADICEECGKPSQYNHLNKKGWCFNCDKASRGQHNTVYAQWLVSRACEVSGMTRTAIIDKSVNSATHERLSGN